MSSRKPLHDPPHDLEQEWVRLGDIRGVDPDVQELLDSWGVVPDNPVHYAAWDRESLRNLCRMTPLVVIQRTDGFHVLGSGRGLRLAQVVFGSDEKLPVLKVAPRRVARQAKLHFLAIDLLGFASLYRPRHEMPGHLFTLWRMLGQEGVTPILGQNAKAFCLATGFSQATIKKSKQSCAPADAKRDPP